MGIWGSGEKAPCSGIHLSLSDIVGCAFGLPSDFASRSWTGALAMPTWAKLQRQASMQRPEFPGHGVRLSPSTQPVKRRTAGKWRAP